MFQTELFANRDDLCYKLHFGDVLLSLKKTVTAICLSQDALVTIFITTSS